MKHLRKYCDDIFFKFEIWDCRPVFQMKSKIALCVGTLESRDTLLRSRHVLRSWLPVGTGDSTYCVLGGWRTEWGFGQGSESRAAVQAQGMSLVLFINK